MTNIYLDIDGVLLANDISPTNYVHEFLEFVTNKYQTYWLTTHCKGDSAQTKLFLSRFLPMKTMELTKNILPTDWQTNKTEAIDFSSPFLWFDDDLFLGEREDLIKHGVLDNWIQVDLRKNINHLQVFLASFPIPINAI